MRIIFSLWCIMVIEDIMSLLVSEQGNGREIQLIYLLMSLKYLLKYFIKCSLSSYKIEKENPYFIQSE